MTLQRPVLTPAGDVWTIEDLQRLPEDGNRYEILNGRLLVTPAPANRHNLSVYDLRRALEAQAPPGVTVHAEGFGVQLPLGSIFVPDLVVMRRATVDRDAPVLSAANPLLVVEVLSPSNAPTDWITKRHGYATGGIPRYWIVDPKTCTITVFVLDKHEGYVEEATVRPGEVLRTDQPFPLTLDPAVLE